MRLRHSPAFTAALLPLVALPLAATHPLPGPHYMYCLSEGGVVRLEWDHMGFAGGGLEARLERDGTIITKLTSSDLGHIDRGVPLGDHTYRLIITQGDSTIDSVECLVSVVTVGPPPPEGLQCSIQEKAPPCVDLQWRNAATYDSVVVLRDGAKVATLDGSATRFTEPPGPGRHAYEVRGVLRGAISTPATCEVDLGGTPVHRLYLFSLPPAGADPAPPGASDQLAVLLDNAYPVTAWSFGLCSDSAFIVPIAIEIGWAVEALNLGAGPEFLAIDLHEGGFTMRAVINDSDPSAILPAGSTRLLTLRYGGGPQAKPGEVHPLEFCGGLGDPPVSVALVIGGENVEPATESGLVLVGAARFLRGDSNKDGAINLTDGIFTLEWLFSGGRQLPCLDAADVNSTGDVDIADAIYTFNFLFLGGAEPPAPFPECGTTAVAVGCDQAGCP